MTIVLPLVKAAPNSVWVSVWVSLWASAAAGLVLGGGGEDHLSRVPQPKFKYVARRGGLAAAAVSAVQRSGET